MNQKECIAQLRDIGRSIGSSVDDVTVVLRVECECILVTTSTGSIQSCELSLVNNDQIAWFSFDSWDTVVQVLSGNLDLGKAFLGGKIRSNGYLTHIFPVMAMFQFSRSRDAPD